MRFGGEVYKNALLCVFYQMLKRTPYWTFVNSRVNVSLALRKGEHTNTKLLTLSKTKHFFIISSFQVPAIAVRFELLTLGHWVTCSTTKLLPLAKTKLFFHCFLIPSVSSGSYIQAADLTFEESVLPLNYHNWVRLNLYRSSQSFCLALQQFESISTKAQHVIYKSFTSWKSSIGSDQGDGGWEAWHRTNSGLGTIL
jgi:hypothetical protein